MTKWKTSNLIIVLVLLFFYPFVFDWLVNSEFRYRNLRYDSLVRRYECTPWNNCQADFDGDKKNEIVKITDCSSERWEWCVSISSVGREIFRHPYNNIDNALRTHIAVSWEEEKPHLLIYDKVSSRQTVGTFAWDGKEISEIQPTAFDKEVLDAMAAHDNTGGWNERGLRDLKTRLGFFGYYTFYVIIVAWIFYKRRQLSIP
jgi:hypothetical protein